MNTFETDYIATDIYGQLLLFPETTAERNARELAELKAHCEKLRKSLYARNNEIHKEVRSIRSDLDLLLTHICKGKI